MSRIVFALVPLSQSEGWAHRHAVELLDITGNYMFFRFGFYHAFEEIGKGTSPFGRTVEAIKELRELYPDVTWIFLGWEVIEIAQQLYDEFPEAEFFIPSKTFDQDAFDNFIKKKSDPEFQPFTENFTPARLIEGVKNLVNCVDVFLENKICTTLNRNPKFSHIKFNKKPGFYINKRINNE